MKTFILLLILLFISNLSNAQWTQTNGPEGCFPTCFARISTGILCGTYQGMYFTSDEGQTWSVYIPFSPTDIHSILSLNDTIIVTFSSGVAEDNIYDSSFSKTSFDGGLTWSNPIFICNTQSVAMHENNDTIITNGFDTLYESDDLGMSWHSISLLPGHNYFNVLFSGNYYLLETTNSIGSTYFETVGKIGNPNLNTFNSASFIKPILIIDSILFTCKNIIANSYEIDRSVDYGQHWDSLIVVDSVTAFNILYVYDDSIYYTDNHNSFHSSGDYGISWQSTSTPHRVNYPFGIPLLNGDELTVSVPDSRELAHYIPATNSSYLSFNGIRGENIIIASSTDSTLYCTGLGKLYKSSDDGGTWQFIQNLFASGNIWVFGDTIFVNSGDLEASFDDGQSWTITSPFLFPSIDYLVKSGNRIYLSALGTLEYTDDFGMSLHQLPQLPFSSSCGSINYGGSLAFDGNILFVVSNGSIYKLDSSLTVWTELFCFTNPHGKSLIYYFDGKLFITCDTAMFISYDHGQSWSTQALNGIPLNRNGGKICPMSLVYDHGDLIGECNKYGVFTSSNDGADWTPLTPSCPFIPTSLTIKNGQLFAGSFFRGVWTTNTILGLHDNIRNNNSGINVFPDPAPDQLQLDFKNFLSGNFHLDILEITGRPLKTIKLISEYTNVTVSELSTGIYFGRIVSEHDGTINAFKFSVCH